MMRPVPVSRRLALAAILFGMASASSAAQASEAQVMIDNFTFSPAEITVAPGTRITWTNRDDIPHTVTASAEPRAFKSSALDTGDSFAFTFEAPGTYTYFCSLHPHMQGSIIVR